MDDMAGSSMDGNAGFSYFCLTCNEKIFVVIDKSESEQNPPNCSAQYHEIISIGDFKLRSGILERSKDLKLLDFSPQLEENDIVINCDASIRKVEREISHGIVVRTKKLEFLLAHTEVLTSTKEKSIDFDTITSTDAEITALNRAIVIGRSYTDQGFRCQIFSDSLVAVNAFNRGILNYKEGGVWNTVSLDSINKCRESALLNPWPTELPVGSTHGNIPEDTKINVHYIERELNSLADIFSKKRVTFSWQSYDSLKDHRVKIILFEERLMKIKRIRAPNAKDIMSAAEYLFVEEEIKEKRLSGRKIWRADDNERASYAQFSGMIAVRSKSPQREVHPKRHNEKNQRQKEKLKAKNIQSKLYAEEIFPTLPKKRN